MIEFLRQLKEVWDIVPWREILLALGAGWLIVGLYGMHRRKSNSFEIDDLFLDRRGKADLYKVILVVMAGLSVYAIMRLLDADKPIETILLGVLAIFVSGRAFNAAFGKDPVEGPPPEPINVEGEK